MIMKLKNSAFVFGFTFYTILILISYSKQFFDLNWHLLGCDTILCCSRCHFKNSSI